MDIKSILFAGVGGDGIITASNVAAMACMLAGFDVKKSEIHGMSQRGGSVSAFVRFGEKVYSPTDALGQVNYLFATEKIEALRANKYLNTASIGIINDRIVPIINKEIDTEDINKKLESVKIRKIVKNFAEDALKLGNPKVINTIMMGVLSCYMPLEKEYFTEAINKIIPKRILTLNLDAFYEGILIGENTRNKNYSREVN